MRSLLPVVSALILAAPAAAQLSNPPVPDGNPITPSKAMLGKALFWDEQLSSTGTMACGSCHMPRFGGADGFTGIHPGLDGMFDTQDDIHGSPGVVRNRADGSYEPAQYFGLDPQVTPRTAPSFLNSAFFSSETFWDGRATGTFLDPLTGAVVLNGNAALESQAADPPLSTVEMGHVGIDWNDVVARVAASVPLALATDIPAELQAHVAGRSYPELYELAFGTPDVTPARTIMAIATYGRTQVSDQAPIDLGTLNELQQAGAVVFDGPGRCVLCHASPGIGKLFSDRDFHNTGVRPVAEDIGRQAVTGDPADAGKFKTPTLRNASLRNRFMHNGRFSTLMEVVEFYDRGGDFFENIDPLMQPLGLTPQQKVALVAYVESFTDPRVAAEAPPFDRPTLFRRSAREPEEFGFGTAGTGGLVPDAIALEPPYVKNPNLTFTVGNARGGANALWLLSLHDVPDGTPYQGATLFVDPNQIAASAAVTLEGAGGVAGAGFGSHSLTLQLSPSSIGLELFQQWLVDDPAASQGVAASEAIRMTLF